MTRPDRPPRSTDPWYKLLGLPILIALASGIGPYATGAPLSRSIGIGLTLGLVGLLVLMSITASPIDWPDPPNASPEWGRLARRWEVPGLDAALERPKYMSRRVLVQLYALAETLLARRGLTMASPDSRDLLGQRNFDLLVDPEATPPSSAELSALIALLTRLASDQGNAPLPIPATLIAGPRRWFGARQPRTRPQQRKEAR